MTALERWKEAGLVEVGLPSGFRIKLLPVTPATLVLFNLAPSIIDEVLESADKDATEEEAASDLGATALDIAFKGIRYLWDDEAQTWEHVSLTAADAHSGAFDPADIEAVMKTALAPIRAEEGQTGYDALRTFRGDAQSDAPGEDGRAVRAAPLAPRRARRSAARAGTRRGAGAAPGAG